MQLVHLLRRRQFFSLFFFVGWGRLKVDRTHTRTRPSVKVRRRASSARSGVFFPPILAGRLRPRLMRKPSVSLCLPFFLPLCITSAVCLFTFLFCLVYHTPTCLFDHRPWRVIWSTRTLWTVVVVGSMQTVERQGVISLQNYHFEIASSYDHKGKCSLIFVADAFLPARTVKKKKRESDIVEKKKSCLANGLLSK